MFLLVTMFFLSRKAFHLTHVNTPFLSLKMKRLILASKQLSLNIYGLGMTLNFNEHLIVLQILNMNWNKKMHNFLIVKCNLEVHRTLNHKYIMLCALSKICKPNYLIEFFFVIPVDSNAITNNGFNIHINFTL
jgi:hypothetical protein